MSTVRCTVCGRFLANVVVTMNCITESILRVDGDCHRHGRVEAAPSWTWDELFGETDPCREPTTTGLKSNRPQPYPTSRPHPTPDSTTTHPDPLRLADFPPPADPSHSVPSSDYPARDAPTPARVPPSLTTHCRPDPHRLLTSLDNSTQTAPLPTGLLVLTPRHPPTDKPILSNPTRSQSHLTPLVIAARVPSSLTTPPAPIPYQPPTSRPNPALLLPVLTCLIHSGLHHPDLPHIRLPVTDKPARAIPNRPSWQTSWLA